MAFIKNQLVAFNRSASVSSTNTPIVSTVNNVPVNILSVTGNIYVIEHASGWAPDSMRMELFILDATKKYLFVKESELTAV